ncbi:MAG: 30S ribosomal protein S16 [Candidatus Bipolaricaulota bacterium]|nr:MAG: 30S ribosomal protein S16 [Candidatus Bipolaricaulota bacterium]
MAAKIRLKKVGRRGQAAYRIVVLDGRKPRDAKVVADLGHYDPKTNPVTFEVDREEALKWLGEGAKATKAARDILSKAGVMAAWAESKYGPGAGAVPEPPKKTKPKAKKAPEPAAAADEEGDVAPPAAPEGEPAEAEESTPEASDEPAAEDAEPEADEEAEVEEEDESAEADEDADTEEEEEPAEADDEDDDGDASGDEDEPKEE